jgi:hypothetical protein
MTDTDRQEREAQQTRSEEHSWVGTAPVGARRVPVGCGDQDSGMAPCSQLEVVVDFLDAWRYCPVSSSAASSRQCLEDSARQLLAALAAREEPPPQPSETEVDRAISELCREANRAMKSTYKELAIKVLRAAREDTGRPDAQ